MIEGQIADGKSVQRLTAERLAPWLALANLLHPTTEGLQPPSVVSDVQIMDIFGKAKRDDSLSRFVSHVNWLAYLELLEQDEPETEREAAKRFYELAYEVNALLVGLFEREKHPNQYLLAELEALLLPTFN